MKDEREQNCTPKEWDHCRVEKMGCRGCYYDIPAHELTNKESPLNQHVLPNPPIFSPDIFQRKIQGIAIEPVELKKQFGSDKICIPNDCDTHTCLRCGSEKPLYCESCYQRLISNIAYLEKSLKDMGDVSFPKNIVLEFQEALRNIIISGEKDDIKLKKIMSTIIFYSKDLK